MKNKIFKLGRPALLSRNMEIVKMAYEDRMTLTQLMKHYELSRSRLSHIITDNWKVYLKSKKKI